MYSSSSSSTNGNRNSTSYHSVYRTLPSSASTMTTASVSGAWNGSNWVNNTQHHQGSQLHPPPPLPSTALPKVPSHMQPLDPKKTPIADLVTHFSAIYQHYSQQITKLKAENTSKNNTLRSSEYQWAEYYADLSTRAAHHYNDLMQKQKQTQVQTHTQKQAAFSSGGGAPPKSFQEYAHRNLSRCADNDSTQKSAMTELIQLTIRKAMRNGTMYSTQWQHEPLLPLPTSTTARTATATATATATTTSSSNPFSSSYNNSNRQKNNTSSYSPYNSSYNNNDDDSNNNNNYNNGKSYLDALKGSSSSSNSNSRGSSTSNNESTNNYYGRQSSINSSSTDSSNTRKRTIVDLTNENNIMDSAKKTRLGTYSYDNALPVNDSYYGKPNNTNTNSENVHVKEGGGTFPNHSSGSYQEKYDQELPENDSYYGRGSASSVNTSTNYNHELETSSVQSRNNSPSSKTTKKKKKKSGITLGKKKEGIETMSVGSSSSDQFQFGDYVSLSSLSTTKYISKNNKLIKVNNNNNNSTATSPEYSIGKKKKNIIKGAMKSNKSKLASRLNRFSGPGGIADATSSELHSTYSQGTEKFMGKSVIGGGSKKLDEEDYESMTVKGTCQVLEKEYLRLTAPPRAELVRPQNVLQKHLQNLKNQWMQYRQELSSGKVNNDDDNNSNKSKKVKKKRRDYNWFCSQLKAIRQDLTVQRIFNAFAVEVYETHAKIALEEGDMNEYNQSQTQLKELYDILTHSGDDESLTKGLQNQNEFIAYRIIYYVFLTGNKKYDGGSSDLFKIMLSLTQAQRKDPSIEHALKVRVAVADNDYHSFFRLQDNCPNSGAYLMDMMIGQIRAIGLQCMMKSYRPTLSVAFILEELGFCFNGKLDLEEGITWLKSCGCKLNDDDSLVHTKDSVLIETNLVGKKSSSLI